MKTTARTTRHKRIYRNGHLLYLVHSIDEVCTCYGANDGRYTGKVTCTTCGKLLQSYVTFEEK